MQKKTALNKNDRGTKTVRPNKFLEPDTTHSWPQFNRMQKKKDITGFSLETAIQFHVQIAQGAVECR